MDEKLLSNNLRPQDHDDFEDDEPMDLEDLFDELMNEPKDSNVNGSS